MNAIDYVKQNGIEKSKNHLEKMNAENWHNGFYNDLKQIVDAFELVDRFGGLFSAKVSLNKEGYTGGIECGDDLIDDDQLKKAINLVEQCL
jgi:hypothetical protein